MKKAFFTATALIILSAVLLVGYGIFLNYKSESVISTLTANRMTKLDGARVTTRVITPVTEKDDILLAADKLTDASAILSGTIQEVYVSKNDIVHKGQPICRLTSEEIPLKLAQIDVSISKAEASASFYEHSYQRYGKLNDLGATSKEKYEEVYTSYRSALAEIKQLQLERQQYELQQEHLVINAPLDGEVLLVYKKAGSYVTTGTAVALIGDFSKLKFSETISNEELNSLYPLYTPRQLQISKSDLDKIYKNGYKEGNKGSAEHFDVRITAIYPPPEVNASMRTVTWEIDNSSGLLEPRHYADVKIFDLSERQALAIPKAALLDNKKNSVYVWKQPEGKLELRKIETGASDGNYVEVRSGLTADEIVITSGKEGLRDGLKTDVELKDGAADEK